MSPLSTAIICDVGERGFTPREFRERPPRFVLPVLLSRLVGRLSTHCGPSTTTAAMPTHAPKESYFPWFRLFQACGRLPFVPSVLLAQMYEEAAGFLHRRPLAAPVFASACYSGGSSPGSVQRATERGDSEFEPLATNGLRSNHGSIFSSCAASRNSVASSP